MYDATLTRFVIGEKENPPYTLHDAKTSIGPQLGLSPLEPCRTNPIIGQEELGSFRF